MITLAGLLAALGATSAAIGLRTAYVFGWLSPLAGAIAKPLQSILTPIVRIALLAGALVVGIAFVKHHYVAVGVKAEAQRQVNADAKIAQTATARVHSTTARRVLDPSTDTTGQ